VKSAYVGVLSIIIGLVFDIVP